MKYTVFFCCVFFFVSAVLSHIIVLNRGRLVLYSLTKVLKLRNSQTLHKKSPLFDDFVAIYMNDTKF